VVAQPERSSLRRVSLEWGAPLLVLALGLGRQVQVNLSWLDKDRQVAPPVASSLLDHLDLTLWHYATGQLWAQRSSFSDSIDLHSLAGLLGWEATGHQTDALVVVVLIFLVGAQLGMFELGRRLGSPWAGVVAALALGVVPDVSTMARCWAPQVPQMFLLVLAALCLLASRSFSRPLTTLGFVAVAIAGACYSPMLTHNLLFVLALAGMAAGAWLRGTTIRRGPSGHGPVNPWKVGLTGVLVVALVAGATWWLMLRHRGMAYHLSELHDSTYSPELGRWRPAAISAYVRWFFWHGLEPPLACAAVLGTALFAWRGRARAELLGWCLLPILVLSLTLKKNHYYAAGVYPALMLAMSLGVARLPRRWPGLVALGIVVGFAWVDWERSSSDLSSDIGGRGMAGGAEVFQSYDPPRLKPQRHITVRREHVLLRRHVTNSCPKGQGLSVTPDGEGSRLAFMLMLNDPCIRHLPSPTAPTIAWVLVRDHSCEPAGSPRDDDPPLSVQTLLWANGSIVDTDLRASPCLWLVHMNPSDPEQ